MKLRNELDQAPPSLGSRICVDDWTVKDLLAVRAWWTHSVANWIEAGRNDECPELPAPGYRWNETPRLNRDIITKARRTSYKRVREDLEAGVQRVLAWIEALDERELNEVGRFEWAGKWPVSRWISINTVRQYTTARTFVRRVLRERA